MAMMIGELAEDKTREDPLGKFMEDSVVRSIPLRHSHTILTLPPPPSLSPSVSPSLFSLLSSFFISLSCFSVYLSLSSSSPLFSRRDPI